MDVGKVAEAPKKSMYLISLSLLLYICLFAWLFVNLDFCIIFEKVL